MKDMNSIDDLFEVNSESYFPEEIKENIIKIKNLSNKTEIDELTLQTIRLVQTNYLEIKSDLQVKVKEKLTFYKKDYLDTLESVKVNLEKEKEVIDNNYLGLSSSDRLDKVQRKKYLDSIKGVNIVAKRANIKASADYDLRVRKTKNILPSICLTKNDLINQLKGKKLNLANEIEYSVASFKANFDLTKTLKNKRMWINLIPLGFLIALMAFFFLSNNITGYKYSSNYIITYGVYVAVVAVGAVFIYSQGSFDMSLGPACLMCAAITGIVFNATHNIWIALMCSIVLGVTLGVINAVLANILDLPVMVMTLTMMNILTAVFGTIITSQPSGFIVADGLIASFNSVGMKWAILIGFALLCLVIFNYTKVGRRNKMIGSNHACAKSTGISIMKAGIISFAISGIGLGLTGFLFTVENINVLSGSVLDTVGLNVIIAIVFGGMPTSGGPRSKISAAIIGAFFCIFLDQVFTSWGIADYRFLAKGVLFLVVVFFTSINMRSKMLAR